MISGYEVVQRKNCQHFPGSTLPFWVFFTDILSWKQHRSRLAGFWQTSWSGSTLVSTLFVRRYFTGILLNNVPIRWCVVHVPGLVLTCTFHFSRRLSCKRLIELHQRDYHTQPHIYIIQWQPRLQPTANRSLLWLLVRFISLRYPTCNQNYDFKPLLHETENISITSIHTAKCSCLNTTITVFTVFARMSSYCICCLYSHGLHT